MLRLVGALISLIWLVMAISTMAQTSPVLDADGQPLQSGVKYHVLPAATDTAGGLTLVDRNGSCPFYVGQEPLGPVVSQGLPVIFTPRIAGETIINEATDFTAAFSASSTCVQSTTWSIGEEVAETTSRYIVTGEGQDFFKIVKNELGLYTFEWCPTCLGPGCVKRMCEFAGILVENGRRFLTLNVTQAFPFRFRRAQVNYAPYQK